MAGSHVSDPTYPDQVVVEEHVDEARHHQHHEQAGEVLTPEEDGGTEEAEG